MTIAVFVEDAGHLSFIRALIERTLEQEGETATILERNSAGGRGATVSSLRNYLRDVGRTERFAEIVVIALDGNCVGWQDRVREIRELVDASGFPGIAVCAVPDPHVEVWYLSDGRAVATVAEASGQKPLPEYKCEPGFYKDLLRQVFLAADMDPPGGGTEFGADIAQELNLTRASRSQESLRSFLRDLRGAIRQIRATRTVSA